MEEINSENFIIIQTEEGILQTADGICVQSKKDGELCFLPPTNEVLEWIKATSTGTRETDPEPEGSMSKRTKWPKEAVLLLINSRIKYDNEFKSTTTKQEVTWKKIAEIFKSKGYNFSTTQCNDKWRYLKARYTAKRDNMGDKCTGDAPIDFPYFEIMDSFLGKKHNVQPIAIASSLQGDTMGEAEGPEEAEPTDDGDIIEPARKKKRLTERIKKNKPNVQRLMDQLQESSREREQARERRHQENLTSREKAINVFSEKMDSLIETLKK